MLGFLKSLLSGRYYGNSPTDKLFLRFTETVTDGDFLSRLKIIDDFDNRFACLAAFMFCWQDYLHVRKRDKLRRDFMDLTVKLLDDSLRLEGVSDIRIGKRVKRKMQGFYAQLLSYDKLFGDHDGTPPKAVLQANLQRYLQTADKARSFAAYLLIFRARLNDTSVEDLLRKDESLHNLFAPPKTLKTSVKA